MPPIRLLFLTLLFALLSACSGTPSPVENAATRPMVRDERAFEALIQHFASQVKAQWGENDYLEASKHDYVKYIDGFRTRAHINFDEGKIWVSTIAQNQPREKLHQAIVETLLMPSDPSAVHMFSDERVELKGKPFLLGQVVDQDNQPIEWAWRANRYADYLIDHKLRQEARPRGQTYYVEIDMVANHLSQREYQYAPLIRAAARRYNLPEDLIYAIIKTESSFNPYAVSHAGAYGLMQVIPKTAGADVFKLVKGRNDIPTQSYLFNPANNIDTGAAYFHLLKTRYLKEVRHPTTLHYSMISAYNGGTGGVLATFDRDRKRAMRDLNSLQPDQVYWALTNRHPKAEARRYLQKVLAFQREFNQGKL
ncbi:Lytic transglycosylase catalytic [Ferrimonas balearica DSM 9799]|uniref:Lytic transglycosylase catalytic n=1 Tax=Ferrimonas balearica (strain DSM 9799 / CCM 4581 / KCTC 23876 / PAT) TaxID=550540 RepID=E1STZ6_FERBD|nr:membrane-bound lytic murein transglycosylase MltC [Ferrimonas balearica]ADN77240.1 Lytic transglycosylase catalytic [Ferrimonas balearica DSM 9799]MBY5980346.1 membrane-bound lytic murein transglycosylase MltC [Ferrimonas balearica]